MRIIKQAQGLLLLLVISIGAVSATERSAPVLIEASEVMIDEPNGVSTYRGDVLFQQGGMSLRADEVKVHSRGSTLHQVEASGSPVKFEIQNAQGDETQAEASRMEYRVADGYLLMEGDAQLWQSGNHFSGGRIEFDTFQDRIVASRQGKEQRVRVVIHPETIEPTESQDE